MVNSFNARSILLLLTVGSHGLKKNLPKQGIELWSLAIRASIITTDYQGHSPPLGKASDQATHRSMNPVIGHQM